MHHDGHAVSMRGITKEYVPPMKLGAILSLRWERERIQALDGIDLDLEQGKVHAFVGPNGAGKTTLLKLVTGLLQPSTGSVVVMGYDTVRQPVEVRARVGYCITDRRSFFLRLSGRENMRFFGTLQGLQGDALNERTGTLLFDMELEDVADRQVMTYSEGMKQRLAIARAFLHEPDVLLLDEIGRGLDPRLRDKVYGMFKHDMVEGRNATLLMASHNMDEVSTLADSVYVMNKGRIVASGTHENVQPAIKDVFRPEDTEHVSRMTVNDKR